MKILVPVKRVADPDNANKVKVSDDGTKVTSDGLEWKMNPFDEWSLEAALRLTEDVSKKGQKGEDKKPLDRIGEVVLVSMGPKDAIQTMRQGLAMGAERGILIEADDEGLDSHVVAQALEAVAKKESPDIVFLGKQSADGDSNVAGTKLAEFLGWPLVNYVTSITHEPGADAITVTRALDIGVQTLKVKMPCVLTSTDRILHPESVKNGVTPADHKYPESEGGRYAPLKGIMAARKKPMEETTIEALGVTPTRTDDYVKFALPPARSGSVEVVESVDELLQKLRADAKVL
ncbi:MAG: electron transfer flavoprotein subunit beta/FixA family protein [Myxococcota bacterium]